MTLSGHADSALSGPTIVRTGDRQPWRHDGEQRRTQIHAELGPGVESSHRRHLRVSRGAGGGSTPRGILTRSLCIPGKTTAPGPLIPPADSREYGKIRKALNNQQNQNGAPVGFSLTRGSTMWKEGREGGKERIGARSGAAAPLLQPITNARPAVNRAVRSVDMRHTHTHTHGDTHRTAIAPCERTLCITHHSSLHRGCKR